MQIQVNGQPMQLDDGSTADELLLLLSLPQEGIALAINGEVIPRKRFPEILLQSGDVIEIVHAVQGGK
ncbi:MAG: sulfur carrier protein ThiS [Deltaproteobacteria bacterium]|nr:sulfur carrier protein ThiS [Deltaproteobacteria bacterium]